MDKKIIDFLNEEINIKNEVTKLNDLIYNAKRYYNLDLEECSKYNISIVDCLKYAYIDELINRGLVDNSLKELYDKYLLLKDKLGKELIKQLYEKEVSKEEIESLENSIQLIEIYLNKYNVMNIKVDFNKIITDQANSYEDSKNRTK